jgi:hypothetical protein
MSQDFPNHKSTNGGGTKRRRIPKGDSDKEDFQRLRWKQKALEKISWRQFGMEATPLLTDKTA